MSLTVDRFSGLNMFLRPDMLLDDFGGSVRADLLPKVKDDTATERKRQGRTSVVSGLPDLEKNCLTPWVTLDIVACSVCWFGVVDWSGKYRERRSKVM